MSAYQVPRALAPTDLHLAGNEGVGPDPELLARLAALGPEPLRRYPDGAALRRQIAEGLSLEAEQVLLTAGGDEGIDRICRWAMREGGRAILPWPGFEMTRRYLENLPVEIDAVPWTEYEYPLEEVLAKVTPETRLIVVTSPNNPTGGVARAGALRQLAYAAPQAKLLVDLAYAEFADEDLTTAALEIPQAVIVRTFSKAWGLAGCRIGYLLSGVGNIDALSAVGGPYPVAAPSLALASERLRNEEHEMRRAVRQTRRRRQELYDTLAEIGWNPLRSDANFVTCQLADPLWARDALAGLGIAVRAWPGQDGMDSLLRIGCAPTEAGHERLLQALRIIAQPQALLFDLDGVLADVSNSYRQCVIETAALDGVQVSRAQIQSAKEIGGFNNDWVLTQALLAQAGVERSLREVTDRFEQIYQGTAQQPGLRRTESLIGGERTRVELKALAQRLPLAIVTGRPKADAERFLTEQGVRSCFQTVVALEDAPNKPLPDPLQLAMQQLQVSRAWMIGDTVDDVAAARAAGCLPFGFRSEAEPLLRAGAARVLTSLPDYTELLP